MDRIEEIMARCLEGPSGEWPDAIDAACGRHPDLADEVRARFSTLRAMGFQARIRSEAEYPSELGDFQLHDRLGGGGMGIVFRATERSLGREVALKLIRPESLYFANARKRFHREVEAVARLQHPGIVTIYKVDEELDLPFFTMELLDGLTLAQLLEGFAGRSPGSLIGRDLFASLGGQDADDCPRCFAGSWVDACLRVTEQVAHALDHAHGRGVLHRDIKPSNIMLLKDGRAVLLDFGLTSLAEGDAAPRVTRTGIPIGTLFYMSPEQVVGKTTPDARTDVYSLGVTLYEMLTLQIPFDGETPLQIQTRVLTGQVDPIRASNRRVSSDTATVCRTAMRSHLAERYGNALSFAQDLARARQGLPIHARPPGAFLRSLRWMQRNRATSIAASALLALIVGLPTGLLLQQRTHAAVLTESFDKERASHSQTILALAGEQQARSEAQEVLNFTVSLLLNASPAQAVNDPSTRGLLERGVESVPELLADHPRARARIQAIFARVYFFWNDYEAGIPPAEAAIATWRGYDDEAARHELVKALQTLGMLCTNTSRYERAEELLTEALDLAQSLLDNEVDGEALGIAHVLLAECFYIQNRVAEALPLARRGLELKRLGRAPAAGIASTTGLVSKILQQLSRLDEAAEEMEAAYTAFVEADQRDTMPFSTFLADFAFLRMGQARYAESAELYRESLAISTKLLGAGSPSTVTSSIHYARLLSWMGDHRASAEAYTRTAEDARIRHAPTHPLVLTPELRAAQEFVRLREWALARDQFVTLEPKLRDTFGEGNRLTAFGLEGLGRCLLELGDVEGAHNYLLEAYDLADAVPSEPDRRISIRVGLARIHESYGERAAAAEYLEQAIELGPQSGRKGPVREALELGIEWYTQAGHTDRADHCRSLLVKLDESDDTPE